MKRAFTLVEVLAVVVLLSLLLAAAVPYFAWVRDEASNSNAINRAVLLNTAKSQYLLEKGYKAHTIFNNKTNSEKYTDILSNYLGYVPSTLAGYIPEGYTYSIGDLNQRVAVTLQSASKRLEY
jgi:prepilin-type N-terminal cleavage/methylation domain-containing protein